MNVVFFLGAGFSAPFGQPVMNSFLEVARYSNRISPKEKEFLDALVLEARRANAMLESSSTNLEDILSFAVMADRLGLMEDDEEPRGPRLKRILQRIYSDVNPNEYFERYDWAKDFFRLESFDGVSIITTNYDLNIESALYWMRLAYSYNTVAQLPFEYQEYIDYQYVGSLYQEDGVPLFKLHGSINWFEVDNNGERFRVDHKILKTVRGIRLPYPLFHSYEYEGVPVIIPPTFLKPDIGGQMLKVWEGAAHALSSAEMIVFVGYSFPPTDVEMRYFLARSLAGNARLRKILVYDLYAQDIVDRLKTDKYSRFGSHFLSFLESHSGDWRANFGDTDKRPWH